MKKGIRRALLSSLLLAACQSSAGVGGSGQRPVLRDLTDVNGLIAAFNGGKGAPRVVLLLSPT